MAPDDAIFTFNVNYLNRNIFYLEKVFSPIMHYYSSSGDSLHTICVITRIKICCTQCEYIFEDNQYLNLDGLHVNIIIRRKNSILGSSFIWNMKKLFKLYVYIKTFQAIKHFLPVFGNFERQYGGSAAITIG